MQEVESGIGIADDVHFKVSSTPRLALVRAAGGRKVLDCSQHVLSKDPRLYDPRISRKTALSLHVAYLSNKWHISFTLMGMATRRSGRLRKATSKASDVLNDEQIFGTPGPEHILEKGDTADIDFEDQPSDGEDEKEDEPSDANAADEDEGCDVSAISERHDESISDIEPDPDARSTYGWSQFSSPRPSKKAQARGRARGLRRSHARTSIKPIQDAHSRGVLFPSHHLSRDRAFLWLIGKGTAESGNFLDHVDRYYDQTALPSRHANKEGSGGMSYSCFQPDSSRLEDAQEAWKWYSHGVGQWAFSRHQVFEEISGSHAEAYSPSRTLCDMVSSGPQGPTAYNLNQGAQLNLEELFKRTHLTTAFREKGSRHGWLLNIGDSVKCLGWAPNQSSKKQFLALSTISMPSLGTHVDLNHTFMDHQRSAFAAPNSEPCGIQIWQFSGKNIGKGAESTIDNEAFPRCVLKLCANWGRIMHFKWCAMPRYSIHDRSGIDNKHLGLLAVICKDGFLRVLDLNLIHSRNSSPRNVMVKHSAFQARPPDTVCTCVTWISTTLIAAGCANGFVAVWDLERYFATPDPPASPSPEIYCLLHASYIFEISTCYPSHPHVIISSSAEGYLRVTDIRDPDADHAFSIRSRTPYVCLEWIDRALSVVCADDACTLKGASLRVLDHFTSIMSFSAPITCLSTSPIHASILVGCADGLVGVTNGQRRLFSRRADAYYRQVWFKNEWRRGKLTNETQNGTSFPRDTYGASPEPEEAQKQALPGSAQFTSGSKSREVDFPRGLSRLMSGYRLENMLEDKRSHAKPKSSKGKPVPSEGTQPFTTIYERETSVTALAWNPNLQVGGWAAAGMGNGLVLVEDLCYE